MNQLFKLPYLHECYLKQEHFALVFRSTLCRQKHKKMHIYHFDLPQTLKRNLEYDQLLLNYDFLFKKYDKHK